MISRISVFGFALATAIGFSNKAIADGHSSNNYGIKVELNNAKVVKLSQPASTIIIGNPEIVDATIQDAQTVILNGRGFGTTNIVILDAAGSPVLDESIAVGRQQVNAVRVYRRTTIESLSCVPDCDGAYLTEAEVQAIKRTAEANAVGDDDDDDD